LIHKDESPESSIVLRIAAAGRSMAAQGRTVETFDTGPNILVTEQSDNQRVEVAVEHDSLMGDQDEIELSIHGYKDGQEENLPVIPRLIFTLQQEKDVWRLTEITVAGHIPLTDPDYLKGLRKQQDEANEQMAQMRMNMIVNGQEGVFRCPSRDRLCLCPAWCHRKQIPLPVNPRHLRSRAREGGVEWLSIRSQRMWRNSVLEISPRRSSD
jgi:hypothetical protein